MADSLRKLCGEVEELLDEATVTKKAERRNELLAKARHNDTECLTEEPEEPFINYLAGLTMYKSFCEDEAYGSKAEYYLSKALTLDPTNQFACLFLGHFYYDTKRFQEALAQFITVDQGYFKSIDQLWRVLTIHELILCCRLFLNDHSLSMDDFDCLVSEFLNTQSIDVPIPWEIIDCLSKTKSHSVWSLLDRDKVQSQIMAMLEGIDLPDEFKNNARLAIT